MASSSSSSRMQPPPLHLSDARSVSTGSPPPPYGLSPSGSVDGRSPRPQGSPASVAVSLPGSSAAGRAAEAPVLATMDLPSRSSTPDSLPRVHKGKVFVAPKPVYQPNPNLLVRWPQRGSFDSLMGRVIEMRPRTPSGLSEEPPFRRTHEQEGAEEVFVDASDHLSSRPTSPAPSGTDENSPPRRRVRPKSVPPVTLDAITREAQARREGRRTPFHMSVRPGDATPMPPDPAQVRRAPPGPGIDDRPESEALGIMALYVPKSHYHNMYRWGLEARTSDERTLAEASRRYPAPRLHFDGNPGPMNDTRTLLSPVDSLASLSGFTNTTVSDTMSGSSRAMSDGASYLDPSPERVTSPRSRMAEIQRRGGAVPTDGGNLRLEDLGGWQAVNIDLSDLVSPASATSSRLPPPPPPGTPASVNTPLAPFPPADHLYRSAVAPTPAPTPVPSRVNSPEATPRPHQRPPMQRAATTSPEPAETFSSRRYEDMFSPPTSPSSPVLSLGSPVGSPQSSVSSRTRREQTLFDPIPSPPPRSSSTPPAAASPPTSPRSARSSTSVASSSSARRENALAQLEHLRQQGLGLDLDDLRRSSEQGKANQLARRAREQARAQGEEVVSPTSTVTSRSTAARSAASREGRRRSAPLPEMDQDRRLSPPLPVKSPPPHQDLEPNLLPRTPPATGTAKSFPRSGPASQQQQPRTSRAASTPVSSAKLLSMLEDEPLTVEEEGAFDEFDVFLQGGEVEASGAEEPEHDLDKVLEQPFPAGGSGTVRVASAFDTAASVLPAAVLEAKKTGSRPTKEQGPTPASKSPPTPTATPAPLPSQIRRSDGSASEARRLPRIPRAVGTEPQSKLWPKHSSPLRDREEKKALIDRWRSGESCEAGTHPLEAKEVRTRQIAQAHIDAENDATAADARTRERFRTGSLSRGDAQEALWDTQMRLANSALGEVGLDRACDSLQQHLIQYEGQGLPTPSLCRRLGLLWDRKGDPQRAVAFFKKSIRQDPQDQRALCSLIAYYMSHKDLFAAELKSPETGAVMRAINVAGVAGLLIDQELALDQDPPDYERAFLRAMAVREVWRKQTEARPDWRSRINMEVYTGKLLPGSMRALEERIKKLARLVNHADSVPDASSVDHKGFAPPDTIIVASVQVPSVTVPGQDYQAKLQSAPLSPPFSKPGQATAEGKERPSASSPVIPVVSKPPNPSTPGIAPGVVSTEGTVRHFFDEWSDEQSIESSPDAPQPPPDPSVRSQAGLLTSPRRTASIPPLAAPQPRPAPFPAPTRAPFHTLPPLATPPATPIPPEQQYPHQLKDVGTQTSARSSLAARKQMRDAVVSAHLDPPRPVTASRGVQTDAEAKIGERTRTVHVQSPEPMSSPAHEPDLQEAETEEPARRRKGSRSRDSQVLRSVVKELEATIQRVQQLSRQGQESLAQDHRLAQQADLLAKAFFEGRAHTQKDLDAARASLRNLREVVMPDVVNRVRTSLAVLGQEEHSEEAERAGRAAAELNDLQRKIASLVAALPHPPSL